MGEHHQKVISASQILSMKFSFNAKSGKVMGRTRRHVEVVQKYWHEAN